MGKKHREVSFCYGDEWLDCGGGGALKTNCAADKLFPKMLPFGGVCVHHDWTIMSRVTVA